MRNIPAVCIVLSALTGITTRLVNASHPFTYVTVFMFNSNSHELSTNQLYITSYSAKTNVLVTFNSSAFRMEVNMDGPKSDTVVLPHETELYGTGKYSKTIIIYFNNFITAVSSNQKENSVETSLVYPMTEWGQQYYIFTPDANGYPKEVAVFSGYYATLVTIELKCTVTFGGHLYGGGKQLTTSLAAFEVLYLESSEDCTGSRILTERPVGVISGHACAWKNSRCQHVFEQLLPVQHWGSSFIVPPLEFQVLQDSVFIFVSQPTHVTYQFGVNSNTVVLSANSWKEILMTQNTPLVISSSQPVQVLYYCTGGRFSNGTLFDPFIMSIMPNNRFCRMHVLEGLKGFNNYAILVVKSTEVNGIQFDKQMPSFNWQPVEGTEFSWAHYTYGTGLGHHTLLHSNASFGVYSIGTVDQNSYGAPAACGMPPCSQQDLPFWQDSSCTKLCQCNSSTGAVTCEDSRCKPGEECTLQEGKPVCVIVKASPPTPTDTPTVPPNVSHCPESGRCVICTHICERTCTHARPVECCPMYRESRESHLGPGGFCNNMASCGCVHLGRHMRCGESVLSIDCKVQFMCLPGGVRQFEHIGCNLGEKCRKLDGAGFCSRAEATCSLLPSGVFRSFDGLEERIWKEGTYTMTELVLPTKDPFKLIITLDLAACETGVNSTLFHYKNIKVEVMKDLTVMVNDNVVPLPFHMKNGLYIVGSPDAAVVQHPSGIILRHCTAGKVSLTLTASYIGEVAGLCGNFNNCPDDDLKLRNGSLADSFKNFCWSWRQ